MIVVVRAVSVLRHVTKAMRCSRIFVETVIKTKMTEQPATKTKPSRIALQLSYLHYIE